MQFKPQRVKGSRGLIVARAAMKRGLTCSGRRRKARGDRISNCRGPVEAWQKVFNDTNGGAPTQKPVALMEYLIRTYTNEGETVLDNTMGSGTTGVACLNTGRRFIGIEKDPEIFATAHRRIAEAKAAADSLLIPA
jgi:DNA modification methylase